MPNTQRVTYKRVSFLLVAGTVSFFEFVLDCKIRRGGVLYGVSGMTSHPLGDL